MRMRKKIALLLALLLTAVALLTGCDGISAETADELFSIAEDVLSDYVDEAESAAQTVTDVLEKVEEIVPEQVTSAVEEVKETAKDAVTEAMAEAEKIITGEETPVSDGADTVADEETVIYGQPYRDKESVAAYLYAYNELPPNYLTKNEAEALGWVSSKGNLWDVTDHGCIGGDRFGNYEGLLPTTKGRKYFECDVDYEGGYRGSDRIIYSNDGLIYYTGDHYASFTLLYGEE